MVASLRHEPSYEAGTWCDEALGVYIGWVARAGSFSSVMPVSNELGDVVLVFSGEEYSGPEVIRNLRATGHSCNGHGASYLLHLAESDHSFPANLNGRFQGILINRSLQTATVFNDRFGLNRLYCHESKDACYFAPEAKAILAVRPELRRIDPKSLAEFISCGCVLENRSLFQGIEVLPPSSSWIIRDATIHTKGTYFNPQEWESLEPSDPKDFYNNLVHVFQECLPRYFSGTERIGMSLTGGLDTRMIMAWGKFPPSTLPCYSFGGMFRECHDVRIARQVARACGQSHQVIRVGEEFLSRFPYYAERSVYLTDGCVRVTHSPDLYVNEIAAEIAPVRMTGNYGGEVLRGIRAFKPVEPTSGLFSEELQPHFLAARQTYSSIINAHPVTFAAFRQAPWHHCGLLALEQTQVALRTPFLDNHLLRAAFRAPRSCFQGTSFSLRLIGDGEPRLRQIPTDRGIGGAQSGIRAALSRKSGDFMAKAEYAYDYGMPQWVAKVDHWFSPLKLERLFLGRHKFYHFRVWYRDFLRDYIRDMLLDSRSLSRSYVIPKKLEAIVDAHIRGAENHTTDIHTLLTLELIHRRFMDIT